MSTASSQSPARQVGWPSRREGNPALRRDGCRIAVSAVALIASIELLAVFPFDFTTSVWEIAARVVLWIAVLGSGVVVLMSIVQHVRNALSRTHA